jgi:nucleotidyltransferase substrate binding protein (TIGR01987 family)
LLVEGVETKTPRESLSQAYQARWLDEESTWLAMLKDRNETSQIYDEGRARQIYEHIRQYHPVLQRALKTLQNRYPHTKAR